MVSVIKEKVLSELFEFENEKEEMENLMKTELDYSFEIEDHLKKFKESFLIEVNKLNDLNLSSKRKKSVHSLQKNFSNVSKDSNLSDFDNEIGKIRRHNRQRSISNFSLNEEYKNLELSFINPLTKSELNFNKMKSESSLKSENYSKSSLFNNFENPHGKLRKQSSLESLAHLKNENNFNNEITLNEKVSSKTISPLNNCQMKILFKDFLDNEDIENSSINCVEKLNNGIYSDNFYQSVYNKYNGLSETLAHKRKNVCLKLLSILKLILPDINHETLKKTIIYIEYKFRTNDPNLGNIYKKKLENFYDKIKEILNLTQDSINLNIKVKNNNI